MIRDFDLISEPLPAKADVCILGAGAVGILLATELVKFGRTVLLLEGGGRDRHPASQELYRSGVIGLPYEGVHRGRFRTYGGTTTEWGGQILELNPEDFEPRAHVAGSGWPFHKTELTTYYERALRFEGLRRVELQNQAIRERLALNNIPVSPEFDLLYSRWCPERNFATLHRHQLEQSRRLTVLEHAGATQLVLNEAGNALTGVRIRSLNGREALITAEAYVICMGGIESTRLLLQPAREGSLPWQANGLLGRYYQDHIGLNGVRIQGLSTQPASRYFGYVMVDGFRYHNKLRMAPAEQQRLGTLNVAATITPFRKENPERNHAYQLLRKAVLQQKLPAASAVMGAALYVPGIVFGQIDQRMRGEGPAWKRTTLTLHSEQSPSSASSISLGDERDAMMMLRSRIDWRVSDQELHTLRTYVKLAADVFARRGFATVEPPNGFFSDDALVRSMCGDSNHHMGGARMSQSAAEGIVDLNLKLHDVANAFLCSSAVFPCSGFSNPTHTLLALGMRLADRLDSLLPAAAALATALRERTPTSPVDAREARRIPLPGSGKLVPQLGFGCAFLLGAGLNRKSSRRLLDAAWDAGVRHFDTARLYGQGHTEGLLREFVKDHPEATLTTKFGIRPPTTRERVTMALARRVPAVAKFVPEVIQKVRFDAASAGAALELSLQQLGREHVDLYLLHEPEPGDLIHDDLLAFLHKEVERGRIGAFGAGGEYYRMNELLATHPAYVPVMQFEHSIAGPHLVLPGVQRIHYRTFAPLAETLLIRIDADPAMAARWSKEVGADLGEPSTLSRLLLRAELDDWPESLMLFSTRSEEHIFHNMEAAADERLAGPAVRLKCLIAADGIDLYQGR